jgi:flagellar biosynthesis/type III secretory pathway protein FliH
VIQTDTGKIVPEPLNPLLRCFSTSQQEDRMAAAKKKTARGRKQDRARVAGGQDYEVRYESKKTGRSAGRKEGRQEGRLRLQTRREAARQVREEHRFASSVSESTFRVYLLGDMGGMRP